VHLCLRADRADLEFSCQRKVGDTDLESVKVGGPLRADVPEAVVPEDTSLSLVDTECSSSLVQASISMGSESFLTKLHSTVSS
jgi:hypothetical protein